MMPSGFVLGADVSIVLLLPKSINLLKMKEVADPIIATEITTITPNLISDFFIESPFSSVHNNSQSKPPEHIIFREIDAESKDCGKSQDSQDLVYGE
jgi:hypothetical protein